MSSIEEEFEALSAIFCGEGEYNRLASDAVALHLRTNCDKKLAFKIVFSSHSSVELYSDGLGREEVAAARKALEMKRIEMEGIAAANKLRISCVLSQ